MSTLLDELEQAAHDAVAMAEYFERDESKAAMYARAAALRARAAHVVELQRKANEYPLAMSYECRVIRALAGPLTDVPGEPGK